MIVLLDIYIERELIYLYPLFIIFVLFDFTMLGCPE